MAWETRGNRAYFYRSRKVEGRVVREYVGGGLAGELAAHHDEKRRQQVIEARERLQQQHEAFSAAEAPHARLSAMADALMRATLLDAGFHQHDRHWRKRRDTIER